MGRKSFDPAKDIPDLSGKVIFVTGGTAGLGKETILAFAKHHAEHIYFSGRNAKSAEAVISDVKAVAPDVRVTFLECDLASLASVEKAAKQFSAESERLDILLCNAGIMALPPGLTKDGYEIQFGTNHVGHALLVKLLLPILLRTAQTPESDVRVVMLTSLAFRMHPLGGIDIPSLRTPRPGIFGHWIRYGQSKLANILFASELARRYPSITTASVHPGVINTGLLTNSGIWNAAFVHVTHPFSTLTPEQGAHNSLWATTTKKDLTRGGFYVPVGVPGAHDKESKSEKLAGELWEWTEKELRTYNA
ncbi:hypothetical protein MMC26_000420 [Xylographa opegraphella]|nr:hypothetical protein [Xylographa opegraphella]